MDALQGIVAFNEERNLKNFDPANEQRMLLSEFEELVTALLKDDLYETVDALCDIIVVAAGGLHKLGYDPEAAVKETVKEIRSRKGEVDPTTGKWEKDRLQDQDTMYKAAYTNRKGYMVV